MDEEKSVGKSVLAILRKIVLGFAIIAVALCGGYLVKTYIVEPYRNAKQNSDTSITDESNTSKVQITSEDDTIDIQAKYSALLRINPDFVGKLYIEAIDDAGFNVVQTDDNDTYLNKGFKGESTRYGTLFADYRNDIKNLNDNTIIYGHNMRDGSQLGSLSLYADIDNYKDYPVIEFNTIYRNNKWKIFAAFITNSSESQDNGYVFPYLTTRFPSDEKYSEFIDEVKSRSYFINDSVDVKPGDKLLTLSTCDTVFEGARFVVMARLVRDGESPSVDTENTVVNEEQRFPQAWYNAKDKHNPFRYADKFTFD